jgi:hypothetical protein
MAATRHLLMAASLLVAATATANAQSQYPAQTPYPSPPVTYQYPFVPPVPVQPYVPRTPPEWSYDPYTSGLGPCPQRLPGDEPCNETMHPTYGQPSYWSR